MISDSERQRLLNNLNKDIDNLFARAAARAGLSDSAFDILYALDVYGDGCSQKDLCERCWMGKQTINSSIKRLCAQGVIEKSAGPGRTTIISLTDAGRALVAQKVRPIIEAESTAMRSLTNEELSQVLSLAIRYRDAFANALAKKDLV